MNKLTGQYIWKSPHKGNTINQKDIYDEMLSLYSINLFLNGQDDLECLIFDIDENPNNYSVPRVYVEAFPFIREINSQYQYGVFIRCLETDSTLREIEEFYHMYEYHSYSNELDLQTAKSEAWHYARNFLNELIIEYSQKRLDEEIEYCQNFKNKLKKNIFFMFLVNIGFIR